MLLVLCSLLLTANNSIASETDSYTGRGIPLQDARPALNQHVNEKIQDVLRNWHGPRNDRRLLRALRWKIEGFLAFRRFSNWIRRNPEIDRIETWHETIYEGLPRTRSTIRLTFHIAPTIEISGTRLGVDKLSHFFSVGWHYYLTYRKHGEKEMIRSGTAMEAGISGATFNRVFSNADIVANYEGHLFYRSILEDGIIPGKPALIRWKKDRPILQRPFEIADHINPFWDEALNSNRFRENIRTFMENKLRALCPTYFQNPSLWEIDPETELRLRGKYAALRLEDVERYRLGDFCRQ